ncbi:transglutaminase family protein [uncultured Sneathiella sp.]|uniref:transglutaminase-like domain-containing protein n=1 Tax=uncultured Sneathiella sp. TaxID=879315 RepID=UPI0030EB98AD|tara:strand:+ start:22605 stop:23309 length:705 start_codon:yes stop_codon:yes gene_type:complete
MTASQENLPEEVKKYLQSADYVDSASPEVQAFVANALADLPPDATNKDKAICLFDVVRDKIRYDPYSASMDPEDYRASAVAKQGTAYCVPKAILLAACLRAAGIPAALGFADVRNHLNTPKLTELMGSDLFIYHGYVQLWLGAESFKITPAFNMELCERFGVKPLVFDGTRDALFHEYDEKNRQHMEYVNDRGLFVDIPMETFMSDFKAAYPGMVTHANKSKAERDNIKDTFTA